MPRVLRIDREAEQAVKDLLQFLMKNDRVRAALTLQRNKHTGGISYSLVNDISALEESCPLFPLMPTNAGQVLSRLTLAGSLPEPVAAVVRPCELRAFVELVKRNQGSLENFVFISSTCGGVYPLKMAVDGQLDKHLPEYWRALTTSDIPAEIRPACQGCDHFLPYNADFTVALIGKDDIDKRCSIFLNTEKAEELAQGIEGEFGEEVLESDQINSLAEKRKSKGQEIIAEAGEAKLGLDWLVRTFSRCIGCHGCSKACPICYCDLCHFDSRDSEYKPRMYEKETALKGAMRIPPDTILYQLGRLTHVGISCVCCGQCTDVCPVDIPLSTIFSQTGKDVQKLFDYVPGRNVEEDLPLTVFETEEFEEVED